MNHHDLASELVYRLDLLIAAVSDSPSLAGALHRERARLLNHLDRCLEDGTEHPGPLHAERLSGPPAPHRPAQQPPSLRGSCYQALQEGLLDARRFDALMLLQRRVQVGSASSSLSPSSSGWPGAPGNTGGGAPADGSCRKRSRLSTMRTCA